MSQPPISTIGAGSRSVHEPLECVGVDTNTSHALPLEELTSTLGSSLAGLTDGQATERQGRFGFNELRHAKRVSKWRLLLSQFTSPLVGLLIVAALVSLALREWIDSCAILAIVLLNGF